MVGNYLITEGRKNRLEKFGQKERPQI